jgi:hypothetical protein
MNSPADSPRSWSFRTAGARAIPSTYTTTKFHGRVPGGSPVTQHHRGIQQCSDSHGILQDLTLFHCTKGNRDLRLPHNLLRQENDHLPIFYSLCHI